jgi:hypothetical protein
MIDRLRGQTGLIHDPRIFESEIEGEGEPEVRLMLSYLEGESSPGQAGVHRVWRQPLL